MRRLRAVGVADLCRFQSQISVASICAGHDGVLTPGPRHAPGIREHSIRVAAGRPSHRFAGYFPAEAFRLSAPHIFSTVAASASAQTTGRPFGNARTRTVSPTQSGQPEHDEHAGILGEVTVRFAEDGAIVVARESAPAGLHRDILLTILALVADDAPVVTLTVVVLP